MVLEEQHRCQGGPFEHHLHAPSHCPALGTCPPLTEASSKDRYTPVDSTTKGFPTDFQGMSRGCMLWRGGGAQVSLFLHALAFAVVAFTVPEAFAVPDAFLPGLQPSLPPKPNILTVPMRSTLLDSPSITDSTLQASFLDPSWGTIRTVPSQLRPIPPMLRRMHPRKVRPAGCCWYPALATSPRPSLPLLTTWLTLPEAGQLSEDTLHPREQLQGWGED